MNRTLPILTLLLVAVLTTGTGCDSKVAAEQATAPELRTYKVPAGYASELRSMLRTALDTGDENRLGRVSLGPSGQLIVVASPAIHEGIEAFIDELQGLEAPPAPTTVSLTYWLVVGIPPEKGKSYEVTAKERLEEIAPALEQIEASQGAMAFRLLERMRLSSVDEDRAVLTGKHAQIIQRAVAADGTIVSSVQIEMSRNQVSSQVKLQPGQFLVLGQSGYAARQGEPDSGNDATLYYIMTADLER
jgi:hypothetical protein